MREVVIVSAVRTPMGSFGGVLSSVSATQLGATAIKGAINKSGIDANLVEEVFMGNVLQANIGQAPARQAAIFAGLSKDVPCTTINKVCSSGMKSVMLAAQSIKSGDNDIVIAGGMENMSSVPHYFAKGRNGQKLGDMKLIDGLVKDVRNYQGVDPHLLGRHHTLVLGKHSGLGAVQAVFARIGISLDTVQTDKLLHTVQAFAEQWKRNPSDEELLGMRNQLLDPT